MAGDERFTRGTVNEALSRGDDLARMQLRAAGFAAINTPTPEQLRDPDNYNGGLQQRRMGRLQDGDLLFRLSGADCTTLAAKFDGVWWFERECMATIRWAARLSGQSFLESARLHLGLGWGEKANLVGGLLVGDFWCLRGLMAPVKTGTMAISGPVRTDVMQIFVPGGLSLANFRQPRDDVLMSGLV